jgi:menaquinone-9 beta-reductase
METLYSDVVIVGAGPAGAATSLFLSREGIPHIILDKSTFPRDKVCGDALSGKVVGILNRLDATWVEELHGKQEGYLGCHGVKFVAPNRKEINVPFSSVARSYPPGYTSKRIDFDAFLAARLPGKSGEVYYGTEVTGLVREGNEISIQAEGPDNSFVVKSRLVVGADGDRSVVLKHLAGAGKDMKHYCAGLRVYYEGVTGFEEGNFIELHFLKDLLPGYFWIFPLPGGHANVGLGMLSSTVSKRKLNLKQVLQDIIQNDPLLRERFRQARPLETIKGWGLPLGSGKRKLSGDNYLLTGDAGSLIDPFTGEGIGNAMISGLVASRNIKKALENKRFDAAFLNQYDQELYGKLGNELRMSHTLQQLLHYPWLFNFFANKATKNKALRETLMSMFEDVNLRAKFKDPSFYFRLLFN